MSCLNYGFVRNLQKPKVSFVDCLYVYVIKKRYQKSSKMNLVKKKYQFDTYSYESKVY